MNQIEEGKIEEYSKASGVEQDSKGRCGSPFGVPTEAILSDDEPE